MLVRELAEALGATWEGDADRSLKLAAPDALKTLVDPEAIKAAVPNVKVRYRKFKDAFETSLQGLSLTGLEMLSEDFQDA